MALLIVLAIVLGITIVGFKLMKAGNEIDRFSKYRKENK